MQLKENLKIISFFLIFLSIASFFLGYHFDENSAGAGTYDGDFQHIWNNLQIFVNNDISSAINHPDYEDSRTPAAYIIHKLFNPFLENEIYFRRSVFIISLVIPVLFYLCLKQKFIKEDKLLLLLISSTIFLSPYFRTTSYWGLEENYGLIFLLLTVLSLNFFLESNYQNELKLYFVLFLITFFSSLCLYFDQKLIIIPIICLFKIIATKKLIKFKFFSIFSYFIMSLPYFYLILLWGNLIPTSAAENRKLGEELFFGHIGYALTIIAFYLLPLLMFKEKNLYGLIKNFLSNNKNYYLISLFFVYLFYLLIFFNFNNQSMIGKGLIYKASVILFDSQILREIFTYSSFFFSWIIILIFIDRDYKNILIIFYFIVISTIMWPIFQEYFDPLIIILAFTFFNSKLYISYKNTIILFLYLSLFLVGSNIYYINLLN